MWNMQAYNLFAIVLVSLTILKTTYSATTTELEAQKFIKEASNRTYDLFNKIAAETYSSNSNEDFEAIFNKLATVQKISAELVEMSNDAKAFDLSKIENQEIKDALHDIRLIPDSFILGDEYFTSVLLNENALTQLSTDKDIEPYNNGANMPGQSNELLSYYPDIQKIVVKSNDPDELKYYWESWRSKNAMWSSVNFSTIVEALKKIAEKLEISALEHWYRFYNNQNFLVEMERVMEELKPFYDELHAFVRHELHQKYGSDVIDKKGPIPDHLYQQVMEQVWEPGSVLEKYFPFTELPPVDKFVEKFDAKEMINEAERFYNSLGFKRPEKEFWENNVKEHDEEDNGGDCKADVFDYTPQVYVKYCPKVNFRKFMQTHSYLSQVHYAKEKSNLPSYYFNSYDLEYTLGEAIILSASTPKHLRAIGLAKDFKYTDKILNNRLFRMGLHTMFNIPKYFIHNKVMQDVLNGTIEMEGLNKHYWKLMEKYAGIEPPMDRDETAIDFPFKFYVNIEDNHQTLKFVSEILGYQFYKSFCKKCDQLHELQNCDFYGNLEIGQDLRDMMALGSSKPWTEVISKLLPENPKLSADALLEYYEPMMEWLQKKNRENKLSLGWTSSKKKVL